MNAPSNDGMECARIRRQLDEYASAELPPDRSTEITKHLENCELCSRELEGRIQVRQALRRSVKSSPVPGSLAAKVRGQLAGPKPSFFWMRIGHHRAVALPGLAILLIVFLTTGMWLMFHDAESRLRSILKLGVDDHMHCAIDAHNYPEVANQPDQIMRELGPEYAALLQVVEQRLPEYQVLEGHICSVPGKKRKYVHFIARGHGAIVSVILTKRQSESFPPGTFFAAAPAGPISLYQAHLNRMDVAGFETKEYFGFIVADLDKGEVLHMANALAGPIRDTLDRKATPGTSKASISIPSTSGKLAGKACGTGVTLFVGLQYSKKYQEPVGAQCG